MTLETQARHRFLAEYRHIRYAEGRGSDDPLYYCALPFYDLTGRNTEMWTMRARTYDYFVHRILSPIERRAGRPLNLLDLGAGNCWMSYRLTLRGHRTCAYDIFADSKDGLLASRHYPISIPCIEGDFHSLPFRPATFDLILYNSSFHYATNYRAALSEARRCLRSPGQVVILDTPVYRAKEHGESMVAERHDQFFKRYGFRADAIPSIQFLDRETLQALARDLALSWNIHTPWYGWRWHFRPLKARLRRRRPPSKFWILVGAFQQS
jgi:SAM-dependent methyltransferase